jgi:glucose dehydrogenase
MAFAATVSLAQSSANANGLVDDWPYYGHDAGGMRYSPLAQINRANVATLKVAWTFHVGDISDGSGRKKRSGLETTPILVDGTLYLTTAFNRVFALDPETGKQRWVYDPMTEPAEDEFLKLLWTRDSSRSMDSPVNRAATSATTDK